MSIGVKSGPNPLLVLYFKEKLRENLTGYTSGGAIFPFGKVLAFNESKNCLWIAPHEYKKVGDMHWFKFIDELVFVLKSRILKIEKIDP